MRRRSRRGANPTVSLFAFQDVMMTTMGILLLVTLLLAVNLTRVVSRETSPPPAETEPPPSSATLEKLRARASRLEKRYEAALADLSKVTGLGKDQEERARRLREELARTAARVRKLEAKIARLAGSQEPSGEREKAVAKKRARLSRLRRRVERLKRKVKERQKNPRLTYIQQEGQSKEPLLVVLTGRRIGVGPPEGRGPALWFTHGEAETRMSRFLDWARGRDAAEEYFVIVLKPSGLSAYRELKKRLRGAGFDVGTDYVPEETRVLVRPGGGGP